MRPALVELMGPAGAGKSTIFEALRAGDDRVVTAPLLSRSPHRASFAKHLGATAVTIARHGALGRHWSRATFVSAAWLRAMPAVLEGAHPPDGDVLVFDQGPLFALTRRALLDERLRPWWESSLERWSALLDVVVWLEAPDEVLRERIDARPKSHRLKGRAGALEALAADRRVLEGVLDRLQRADAAPTVLRFDTGAQSATEIAAQVLRATRVR